MIKINVDHKDNRVHMGISGGTIKEQFGVEQIYTTEGLSPNEARELAALLVNHASEAENSGSATNAIAFKLSA